MGVTVSISFEANDDFADTFVDGIRKGVALAGERLVALSTAEAPFDLGTLAGSAAVSALTGDADPTVEVTYDTPYAARLHEHPEYNFQGGRKGKYLEDPALQNAQELGDIIATAATRD